jgi:hypothetical protein
VSLVALYVGLIQLPLRLYFYVAHPDWSWLYLLDPGRVPRLAIVSIAAACVAFVALGYYGGARLVRAGREKIALGGLAGGAVALLVAVLMVRGRLGRYGTYTQFHEGRALSLGAVKLGYVLVAVVIGVAASAAFVGWELHRDGRRAAAR